MTKLRSHIKIFIYIVITKFVWNVGVRYLWAPDFRWSGDGVTGKGRAGVTNDALNSFVLGRRDGDDFATEEMDLWVVDSGKERWRIKSVGTG